MACDKQPSFGSLLEQLIVASYAMRIDLGKRVLERVEAQVAELTRERDEARDIARKVPGLELELKAKANECEIADGEVTRLTAALAELRGEMGAADWEALKARAETAEARVRELDTECTSHVQDTLRLSEECAALRAEVERLRNHIVCINDERSAAEGGEHLQRVAAEVAESRLTAANALLEDTAALSYCPTWLKTAIRAHLAEQPATAPLDGDQVAKACCDIAWNNGWVLTYKLERAAQPATAPARDEAEQAALDALCDASSGEWVCGDWLTETQCDALNAAMRARRGAKQ